MAENNANVRHRLEKMVMQKLTQNVSWCGKSECKRQAQAGVKCGAKANAQNVRQMLSQVEFYSARDSDYSLRKGG